MQDPAPYFAVVLDGPCVGTSTAFVKGGISEPNMIIAPQFNDKDAAEMEKQKMCKVVRSTLSDTIRYSEDRILEFVSIFNLDFMGSVFGRKRTGIQKPEVYPLSDFNDCLSKTKEKEVIISLTVSERMGVSLTKEKIYFEGREGDFGRQIHKDFLTPIVHYNQYRVLREKIVRYQRIKKSKTASGTAYMWCFIYYLRKDLRLDPSTVEFAKDPDDPTYLWGFNPDFDDSYI